MTLYETSGHLILKSNVTYELLVLQLDTNHQDGEKKEDGRWGGREGGWKRGRAEEVR